jgi:filamentous hemagglutinin family protein
MNHRSSLFCLSVTSLGILLTTKIVQAQVIPDGSVNTIVTPSRPNFAITGGSRSGNNLFHSFSEFGIPTGGSVLFDNALDVQNIFSRVTGSNPSKLDGALQANGMANLFLLNPNGVIFGPNARLNIGGSFLTTTANTIKFDDGGEFSATNSSSLLTVSVPIGLQFGLDPGPIVVNQSTLRVPNNQSLLLAGNDLNITGKLYAEGGRMDFASIGGAGIVDLIRADRQALGLRLSAPIARGNLTLGADRRSDILTRIYTEAPQGGSLHITAQNADLLGDTAIYGGVKGTTLPNSVSGDLNFDIRDRLFLDYAAITNRVNTSSQGHAGNVNIRTGSLKMIGGSFLSATTRGIGNAGSVQVVAREGIWLDGQDAAGEPTGIFSSVRSTAIGQGGQVLLNAAAINFTNGAIIELVTQGKGDAGRVNLTASDRIVFTGAVKQPDSKGYWYSSSVLNNVSKTGIGHGGDIEIIAPTIAFTDGATLLVNTRGQGNAGNILLQGSRSIRLDGMSDRGVASSLQSDVEPMGIGNGGNIVIQTPDFQASRGAFVSVSSAGNGAAGNLRLEADRARLFDRASLQANANDGNQGNITIRSRYLSLRDASHVIATATGQALGGNVLINTDFLIGRGNSDIVANAIVGRGGNIQITAQGIFGLKYRPLLTLENDITASSEFGVNGMVQVDTIGVDPNSGLVSLPVDLADASQQIATGCSSNQRASFVITGRGGVPSSPIQGLKTDRPWQDTRHLAPSTLARNIAPPELIEATSWEISPQGQPQLIAGVPIATPQNVTCAR